MSELKTEPIAPPDLVTVVVNGVEKKYPKGKNLLAALLDDNVYVPHYCWHPSLSVAGNCRLCLIEMVGQPRPSIACNMNCSEGLKINTEGAMVEDCRKGMMEFLLVNHPLDCPICDRGGECMLQRYSVEYGFGTARTKEARRRFFKPQFDSLIDIERNRCILCTRCVRFMDEVAGEHLMGIFQRGNRNYIGTFGDGPVSSIFSGNVIDICPVGCLTSKPYRFTARPWELQQVVSTCTLCSAGCKTTSWLRDGQLYRTTPPARRYLNGDYTLNEDTTEFLCNEGRFGNYYADSGERIHEPKFPGSGSSNGHSNGAQPNGNGVHAAGSKTAEMEKALDAAADALRRAAAKGPGKVAVLCGGRATNEEYFLLSRMARAALGTNQIDWRLDYVSDAAARAASDALAASDGDLDALPTKGYAATLVVNAELLNSVPVIGLRIKEAARLNQTRLALLGSRLDPWLSKVSKAGASVAPEKLGEAVRSLAAALGGGADVPAELAGVKAALAGAATGLVVLGIDTAGGLLTPELVPAVFELLSALGAGWNFLPVYHARNAKGAFAAGAQADRLPGHPLSSSVARASAAEMWGALKSPTEAGPSAPEILRRAAAGEIDCLFLHRCDELIHHPQADLVRRAIENTPEVIAIDVLPSWITEKATIVLPGAVFYETQGSMTSADGSLQSLTQGNSPAGMAQEDWRLILALSERLGVSSSRYAEADHVFRDLLTFLNPPKRFGLMDLRLEGPGAESPQRPQPIIRRKARPNFKVRFSERAAAPAAASAQGTATSAGTPVAKADGALRLIWHLDVQGMDHLASRSFEFDKLRPEPAIELNPEDAAARGLAAGDQAEIKGLGAKSATVKINATLARGVAFGASNTLGLELPADAAGLPLVEPKKTGK